MFTEKSSTKNQLLVFVILILFLAGVWFGNQYGFVFQTQAEGLFSAWHWPWQKETSQLSATSSASFQEAQNPAEKKPAWWEFDKWFSQSSSTSSDAKEKCDCPSQEEMVIAAVKKASPAVVSIIITKDMPVYEQYYVNPFPDFFGDEFAIPQLRQKGTQKQNVGGGTGFIISTDGLVLTNKHVVSDKAADYMVITNDGKKYPAKVLALDPFQDLAVIKIQVASTNFPILSLGNSANVQIGQTVITIGNALGEFRNTVSVGVVSGLGRTINASGGGMTETLEDLLQTDAGINKGNSGGPLLDLKGEVIGVNVAMAEGAQNIGFAIPINTAKRDIQQVKSLNKIVYPFLGVRYVLLTAEIQEKEGLAVGYGAWIIKGEGDNEAIIPGSAADKAGIKEGDIILEADGKKVTVQNSLGTMIQQHSPGDKIVLKVLRDKQELMIEVVLGEKTSE